MQLLKAGIKGASKMKKKAKAKAKSKMQKAKSRYASKKEARY